MGKIYTFENASHASNVITQWSHTIPIFSSLWHCIAAQGLCENQGIVKNASILESTLSKKHEPLFSGDWLIQWTCWNMVYGTRKHMNARIGGIWNISLLNIPSVLWSLCWNCFDPLLFPKKYVLPCHELSQSNNNSSEESICQIQLEERMILWVLTVLPFVHCGQQSFFC